MKNSNTVALERRMDLASLFCMIGRHGPAVALAVVAMASVLAAFVIYRTVRGKRRKATAAAADSDGKSPGAEKDASGRHEPSLEESLSCVEATDVTDKASPEADRLPGNSKLRLRRAAADEEKTLPCSPLKSRIQVSHGKQATSHDTQVFKAAYQGDESVATDNDASDEKHGQEDQKVQQTSNNPVYVDQTLSERLLHNKCTSETEEEPVTHLEVVATSFTGFSKDEKMEEHLHPDNTDKSNNQLCPEEINEAEDKMMATVHCIDGDVAGDVMEEDLDNDNLNEFTAVKSDIHSSEEINQRNGLACNEEESVCHAVISPVKEKMLTRDRSAACGEDCHSSCVILDTTPPLNLNHYHSPSENTTDAKTQLSGIADFLDCQRAQTEMKEGEMALTLYKNTALNILQPDLENKSQCGNDETGTAVVFTVDPQDVENDLKMDDDAFDNFCVTTDKFAYYPENATAPVIACYKDKQNCHMVNNEAFDETNAAADKTDEDIRASVKIEDSSPNLPFVCQDQQKDCMENGAFNKEMVEEMSHPDKQSSFQVQQSDQVQNNSDFEVALGAVTVITQDSNPICKMKFLSFEQSELRGSNNDSMSSPGAGKESGISSLTVSPDVQDAGNESDVVDDNVLLPLTDCDPQSDERTEAQSSLFADDGALTLNEDAAGTVPYPFEKPHSDHTDGASNESIAANEDAFGHDIEDGYHSTLDRFINQIAESVMSFTSELTKKMDVKCGVEVVEVKESKEQVSAENKVEKAEKEKEEYEKTEISIMEATMDNNEWITDGNYQVLPWMNLSVPSFAQDNRKSSQPISPFTDGDIAPINEVRPTNTHALGDEKAESNKKVVAVQPMPQNVSVVFRIHYLTHSPFQTVAVTGNQQELGNWKGFIPLERAKDGHWATVVSLPAESHVEWKFVLVEKGEVCRWEECGNRLLDTGCGDDLIVHKWWGLL